MGSIEIRRTVDGKFQFTLVAGNGQVIASSTLYGSKRSVLSAIESMRNYVPKAQVYDFT